MSVQWSKGGANVTPSTLKNEARAQNINTNPSDGAPKPRKRKITDKRRIQNREAQKNYRKFHDLFHVVSLQPKLHVQALCGRGFDAWHWNALFIK